MTDLRSRLLVDAPHTSDGPLSLRTPLLDLVRKSPLPGSINQV